MEKMRMKSINLTEKNIDIIGALFPSVITETKDENGNLKKAINFALLKQLLSEDVIDGDEAYEFTWVGKKASIIEAGKPIRKTLRPCREESKDWDTSENLYIEGDNLDVLKLLQESYLGAIKMIYIDPPYNTGKDFIYRDNFRMGVDEYDEASGVYDEDDKRLFQNSESNGRFHSDWCTMMYSRLSIARSLLTDDGAIFISIDDNEVDTLRMLCNEVFGNSCFVAQMIWKSRQNKDNRNLTGVSVDHEYILVYSKTQNNRVFKGSERNVTAYTNPDNDPRGDWTSGNMVGLLPEDQRPNCHYDLINPYTQINYGKPKMGWRYDKNTMSRLIKENRILWPDKAEGRPRRKVFLNELSGELSGFSSFVGDKVYTRNGTIEIENIFGHRYFDFPKPSGLIKELIEQGTERQSIILDFFSGSSTSAQAVMHLNSEDGGIRKYIMVQLPEVCSEDSAAYKAGYKNICEIGKERIRRAGEKIKNEVGQLSKDIDVGFCVFKLDSTNMKDVYYSTDEYSQDMLAQLESNIKEDRTDLDLLFGCLLEWGLSLSLPHVSEEIEGVQVHTINDGDLIACFAQHISEVVVKEIAKRQPLRAVFRDNSFANSPEKLNVVEIFKLMAPNTTVKVI